MNPTLPQLPAELLALDQWLFWEPKRLAPSQQHPDGKITKIPMSAVTSYPCDVTDLDQLTTVRNAQHTLTLFSSPSPKPDLPPRGIGFSFVDRHKYVGVDMDDRAKLLPENQSEYDRFFQLMLSSGTYVEQSISGKGYHFIFKVSDELCRSNEWQHDWGLSKVAHEIGIEIYRGDRYFTMSADIPEPEPRPVLELDEFAIETFKTTKRRTLNLTYSPDDIITTYGRSAGLSNEAVINQTSLINKTFMDAYTGRKLYNNDWSVTLHRVIGDLDKVTGDPQQIYDLVKASPLVANSGEDKAGHNREEKFHRTFEATLSKARENNDLILAERQTENRLIEYGLVLIKSYLEAKETKEIEAELAERQILLDEEAAVPHINIHKALSRRGHRAMESMGLQYYDMSNKIPPGRMGDFVQEVREASRKSNNDITTALAFTMLSGIISRRFKDNIYHSGPIIITMIAARSATGKSSTMDTIRTVIKRASNEAEMFRKRQTEFPDKRTDFIHECRPASVQGLMDDIVPFGVGLLETDEGGALWDKIVDPKNTNDVAISEFYLRVHGNSKFNSTFAPEQSRTTKKLGTSTTHNPSQSVVMMMTPQKGMAISADSFVDGFASRTQLIFPREEGTTVGKTRLTAPVTPTLSPDIHHRLTQLLSKAIELQHMYYDLEVFEIKKQAAHKDGREFSVKRPPDPSALRTDMVFPIEIEQEISKAEAIFDDFITNQLASDKDDYPAYYVALARVPHVATRHLQILGMMNSNNIQTIVADNYTVLPNGEQAICGRHYYPLEVTKEDWLFCFNYVLYHTLNVLHMADNGEISGTGSDGVYNAIDIWMTLSEGKINTTTKLRACTKSGLLRIFRQRSCTYRYDPETRKKVRDYATAAKMLDYYIEVLGIFKEVEGRVSAGRDTRLLVRTNHDIWQEYF